MRPPDFIRAKKKPDIKPIVNKQGDIVFSIVIPDAGRYIRYDFPANSKIEK